MAEDSPERQRCASAPRINRSTCHGANMQEGCYWGSKTCWRGCSVSVTRVLMRGLFDRGVARKGPAGEDVGQLRGGWRHSWKITRAGMRSRAPGAESPESPGREGACDILCAACCVCSVGWRVEASRYRPVRGSWPCRRSRQSRWPGFTKASLVGGGRPRHTLAERTAASRPVRRAQT